MGRAALVAITIIVLMLQSSLVIGSSGQVLKVVDGDTFLMEVAGSRGQKTLEVNLRCSDAPLVSAPFGQESRQYLETLLHGAEIYFKIQAYCGSETCVEVLAYIPDPTKLQITYINTQMIAAGMARNASCRGVFNAAEIQAKAEKKGIWSTTKKIAFAEPVKVAKPGAAKASRQPTMTALNPKPAAALIEVDRAERTVTLKSKGISLSKAIKAIDTVSTQPVSLYLIEEQYIALSMEKVSWYAALQSIVEKANLKQVNVNGKIDLYDQLFYYKHIAPFLKLSDNDGVYIKAGSGNKAPVVDDGVTRYVFINDFENSAADARQKTDAQSGFVQVHPGGSKAPVSNYGRFEVSKDSGQPAIVAVIAPEVTRPAPVETPPKPISQNKVVVEPEKPVNKVETSVAPVTVAGKKPAVEQVVAAAGAGETVAVNKAEPPPQSVNPVAAADEAMPKTPQPNKPEKAETKSAGKVDDAPVLNIELNRTELIVLLIVIVVVVFGAIFLSRSAASRAAKAERSVDPDALAKKGEPDIASPEPLLDKAYEQEVFNDIDQDQVDSAVATEKAVDDIFRDDAVSKVEPATEEAVGAEVAEPAVDAGPTEAETKPAAAEEPKTKKRSTKKQTKKSTADAGNYAVTLDDYERLMKPPKREPRKDCLFEIACSLDGRVTTGIGLDISSGGLFVDSKENYTVGKVLELEFKLTEEDSEPVRCRCGVTWINERPDPIKPNYPNGFGVCFLDMDAATRNTLDEFLELNANDDLEETEADT